MRCQKQLTIGMYRIARNLACDDARIRTLRAPSVGTLLLLDRFPIDIGVSLKDP